MAKQRIGCLPWVLGIVVLSALYFGGRTSQNVGETQSSSPVPIQSSEGSTPGLSLTPSQNRVSQQTMYVTASSLSVRSSPDPAASILFKAGKGTAVVAVGVQGDWTEVKL
jgi:hypothetical protein